MIFSNLLIFGIGYGIASWISSTGLAYWRSIVGFTLAFMAAWLGGGYLTSVLLFPSEGAEHSMAQLIAKGMGWALIGAGYGVYQGRRMLKTGNSAPLKTGSSAPSFDFFTLKMTVVGAVVGLALVFAVPVYKDYTKRQESSNDAIDLGDFAAITPANNANTKAPKLTLPVPTADVVQTLINSARQESSNNAVDHEEFTALTPANNVSSNAPERTAAAQATNGDQPPKLTSESALADRLQELVSCKKFYKRLDCKLEFRGLNIEIAGASSEQGSGGTIYVHKLGAGQTLHMQGNCLVVDFKKSFQSENPFALWILVRNDGVIRPHSNYELANTFCSGV